MIRTRGLVAVRACPTGGWHTVRFDAYEADVTLPAHAAPKYDAGRIVEHGWSGDDVLTDPECPRCCSPEPCHQRVEVLYPRARTRGARPTLYLIHEYEPEKDFQRCSPS